MLRLKILITVNVLLLLFILLSSCKYVSDGTHTVSGRITLCDPGLVDVELTIENERFGTLKVSSDADGNFNFYEVKDDVYTVTPEKEGFTFIPESREIDLSGYEISHQDFVAIVSWTKSFGQGSDSKAYVIEQTMDCGYVAAGFKESIVTGNDIWVIKLDVYGEIEWEKTFDNGFNDIAYSIEQTLDEGYIVAGKTDGGGDDTDFWILKLDSDGEIVWEDVYGDGNFESASSIQQLSVDSGYIAAGYTDSDASDGFNDFWILKLTSEGIIDGNGSIDPTYGYGDSDEFAFAIRETDNEGYIVAGDIEYEDVVDDYTVTKRDALVWKLDSELNEEWMKRFKAESVDGLGENDWNEVRSIEQTSDGGYILAGWTDFFGEDITDFWILKLASDGEREWEKTFDGGFSDKAYTVKQVTGGGYITAGFKFSYVSGNNDFWILKLDFFGDIEWEQTYSGTDGSIDEVRSIDQTSDGGYIFTGNTQSFEGNDYVWIMKLDRDGNLIEVSDGE